MSGIIIEKEIVNLIKREVAKASAEKLRGIAEDAFEDSYEFILCDSMGCELDEIPVKLRGRLIKNNSSNFTDSDLVFSDLTEAVEHFLYTVSINLVEEFAENYSDDDNYDIEDNDLHRELMDIYAASVTWCDFEFNRESDRLTVTTYNFLDFKVQIDFEISRMNEREYICDLLIAKLKEVQ